MFEIKIVTIGRIKDHWLKIAIKEYQKRMNVNVKWILAKNDDQLIKISQKDKNFICLNVNGKQLSSIQFSKLLINLLEKQKCKITFVIGGAEGIPKKILSMATLIISFSKFTFTHQITRLILLEQLYRCFEIYKGSNYHK